MTAAVGRVSLIRRDDCRAAAERRFSAGRMVADYEQLYRRIVLSPGDCAARLQAAGPARLTA